MDRLLNDKTFTDAIFIIEGKEIRVHKCILALESEYFKTFFLSSFYVEKNAIKDVSFDIFDKIITFIYTKKIDIPPEKFAEVSNLAEMYIIESLKKECMLYLHEIEVDVFIEIFPYIKSIPFLRIDYMRYISSKWQDIVENDRFYEILLGDADMLKVILKAIKVKAFVISIDDEDRKNIIKILEDKANSSPPSVKHRILELMDNRDNLFKDPKNIEKVFRDLKIIIPTFFMKYLE